MDFRSFVVIKVMVGVNLVGYATRRRSGMEARQTADVVNDFGRDPIGEGKEEQVRFIGSLSSLLVTLKNDLTQSFITANLKHYWIATEMMCRIRLRLERTSRVIKEKRKEE